MLKTQWFYAFRRQWVTWRENICSAWRRRKVLKNKPESVAAQALPRLSTTC